MSDSYDGTPEETDNSEQKYVISNQKRFRSKREKPVSYLRPALQPVISVEKRLPMSDKMKMKQHGFHATLTV